MTTKLLKLASVADTLTVSVREARNLCERGELRAMKIGRNWRVHPDDLEAFVRERRGLTAPVLAKKAAHA